MRILLLACVLLLGASRCRLFEWSKADRFESSLRCGMTTSEVSKIGQMLGAPRLTATRSSEQFGNYAIREGRTTFWLWFTRDRLEQVQRGRNSGLTGLKRHPRVNLCTGEKLGSIELLIKGSQEWAEAKLSIDGDLIAIMPSRPPYETRVTVESGSHELMLDRGQDQTTRLHVVYEHDATGTRQITLPSPRPRS